MKMLSHKRDKTPGIEWARRLLAPCFCALACAAGGAVLAQGSGGPYVPTPAAIVEELLKLADVKRSEYLIDLGSGDGRIVITAAKRYGASGHGIDIQDSLVELARKNAREQGVADRARFIQGDLFESDLSRADIVTVYLLPSTVPKLVPKLLAELKPGARVVSHDYALDPWIPERVLTFDFEEKISRIREYLDGLGGLVALGRFGRFEYHNADQCIRKALDAARALRVPPSA